jgi:hypothetical protein
MLALVSACVPASACSIVVLSSSVIKSASAVHIGYITGLKSLEPLRWPNGSYLAQITPTRTFAGKRPQVLYARIGDSCDSIPHVDQKVVVIVFGDGQLNVFSAKEYESAVLGVFGSDR